MTRPEDALERAREAAARKRTAGGYADAEPGWVEPGAESPGAELLLEWAQIDVDLENVRSTRRLGAPITAVKRGLVRLLRQYDAEASAQQTRFNIGVVTYLLRLEERVTRLERGGD